MDQENYEKVSGEKAQAPESEWVRLVDRLRSDVVALSDLTQADEPVLFKVRASSVLSVLYLVGDASGKGFGLAMWDRDGIFNSMSWDITLLVINAKVRTLERQTIW